MSTETNSLSVIDGVKIWTDENGTTHFEPVEQPKPTITVDNRSWWKKLKDWWNDVPVKPYIKKRDLSDPFGDRKNDPFDDGSGGKSATEIGIKISF